MGTHAIQTIAPSNNSLRTTNIHPEKTKYTTSTFTDMRASSSIDMIDHDISFRLRRNESGTLSMPMNNPEIAESSSKNADQAMTQSLNQECQSLFLENASQGRKSQDCGNYDEALAYFRCALLCKRSSIANETLEVQLEYANILFRVGLIYMDHKHNFSFSSEAFQQCLDIRLVCLDQSHIDVSATMYCLAKSLMKQERDHEYVLELLNESLSILLNFYPSNFNGLIKIWKELAQAQYAVGATEDAESSMQEVRNLTLQAEPFM